jgi:hypothetical protein
MREFEKAFWGVARVGLTPLSLKQSSGKTEKSRTNNDRTNKGGLASSVKCTKAPSFLVDILSDSILSANTFNPSSTRPPHRETI